MDDYTIVAEEAIDDIEIMLTLVVGQVVYGAAEFSELAPERPAISPAWSPVSVFGGCAW